MIKTMVFMYLMGVGIPEVIVIFSLLFLVMFFVCRKVLSRNKSLTGNKLILYSFLLTSAVTLLLIVTSFALLIYFMKDHY
jgi:hypothetical protein